MKKLNAIILLMILSVVIGCSQTSASKIFNANDWRNWKETESTMFDRLEMANDLIRTDALMMFDKKEIIELLGEPNIIPNNSIAYFLGHSGNGINTSHLTILFDDSNKAIKFSVLEH